jgi:putative ATP-dependent endonuclease of OLD family
MHLEQVIVHGLRAASEAPYKVEVPGRFAVVAGANAGGKSTLVDAIVLAHHDVFPFAPRPPSAVLSQAVATRTIEVAYTLPAADPSPLGDMLRAQGAAPTWTTTLTSSMGRVSASSRQDLRNGQLPVLYLSPTRNPSVDLAGREAQLIVELLKSQGLRDRGEKSLTELRGLLGGLIGSVVNKWPVNAAEERVGTLLAELTDGVSGRVPYLGTTRIDDTFLARVFEFLIATTGTARAESRRLETDGLGYANLLELAVILAAIPDLTRVAPPAALTTPTDDLAAPAADGTDASVLSEEDRQAQMRAAEENAALEGETFFAGRFHAIVVLEEPEAHLHPQLQHGLVTYLKEVVRDRPEVQVLITTHSDQIVAACEPDDLVVCVRTSNGPAARTVKNFKLNNSHRKLARRHLDASRSASVFADRAVLVEGVTDATVLRAFARVWAGDSRIKRRFVDALTITVVGSRVGPWLYRLLVDPHHPISTRLAVLSDSDGKPAPKWVAPATAMSDGRLGVFLSEPTLEPSLVEHNHTMFHELFDHKPTRSRPWPDGGGPSRSNVNEFFKKGGRSRKAAFADDVADYCAKHGEALIIPDHIMSLLEFVWAGFNETPDESERTGDAP